MAGVVSENFQSRRFTVGRRIARELIFDVQGTGDEDEVLALIAPPGGAAPAVYLGLLLEDINVEPNWSDECINDGLWKVTVSYIRFENDTEFTFDTTGGTEHITQSLVDVASFGRPGETPPDFKGAIGVTDDRVEGVDVTVPKLEFTETYQFLDEEVGIDYKLTLSFLTGSVNQSDWKGYPAGTLKFMGAVGSKRGDDNWSITFRFAHNANRHLPYDVGEVTGVTNDGWHYVWTRYAEFEDGTAVSLARRPISVHVAQVAPTAEFSDLGIGS